MGADSRWGDSRRRPQLVPSDSAAASCQRLSDEVSA